MPDGLQAVDPVLIRKLCAGDERAFHAIYLQLHTRIYRFALSFLKDIELSKEITQEAFLYLWLNREKLSEDLPLYPYLFTKVRRLTIDVFRRSTVVERVLHELVDHSTDLSNETEDTILWNDLNRLTEECLSNLPQQQQTVFRMSRIQGLSYDEIAKELNISRNTVKYHLVCALKNLRSHFVRHDVLYMLLVTALFFS